MVAPKAVELIFLVVSVSTMSLRRHLSSSQYSRWNNASLYESYNKNSYNLIGNYLDKYENIDGMWICRGRPIWTLFYIVTNNIFCFCGKTYYEHYLWFKAMLQKQFDSFTDGMEDLFQSQAL